ncbi:hypothetical protein [Achromobacter xylosoxidans]|jgi:hypothetical protein|uniref:hypothetical protein n=1 Tax=Alcaligenes xylosoxydans xylosoxydans TaxID=85698 RepID=UPI000AA19046|nr:hypothetical protein [Achromobacter xylosoxidans]
MNIHDISERKLKLLGLLSHFESLIKQIEQSYFESETMTHKEWCDSLQHMEEKIAYVRKQLLEEK